jgi:ketopantoate hydroxymethyltransferase
MEGQPSVKAAMTAYVAAVKNCSFPENALHAW